MSQRCHGALLMKFERACSNIHEKLQCKRHLAGTDDEDETGDSAPKGT